MNRNYRGFARLYGWLSDLESCFAINDRRLLLFSFVLGLIPFVPGSLLVLNASDHVVTLVVALLGLYLAFFTVVLMWRFVTKSSVSLSDEFLKDFLILIIRIGWIAIASFEAIYFFLIRSDNNAFANAHDGSLSACFYLSLTTITTLGCDIQPIRWFSRILVASESIIGILVLVLAIPVGISLASSFKNNNKQ